MSSPMQIRNSKIICLRMIGLKGLSQFWGLKLSLPVIILWDFCQRILFLYKSYSFCNLEIKNAIGIPIPPYVRITLNHMAFIDLF